MSFEDQSSAIRFEYQLAERLGKTHAELVNGISNPELAKWKVYFSVLKQEREEQEDEE